MDTSASQNAINFALNGDWKEAVHVNLQIILESPEDVEAMNRLARAYTEIGEITKAKKINNDILNLDPVNSIALKRVEKWKTTGNKILNHSIQNSTETFLEEPGKTKLITLSNLGNLNVIVGLNPGCEVELFCHAHKLSVLSSEGKYIGKIPDLLASRLRSLMKTGNKYQALVKSVSSKEVTIFVREIERGAKSPTIPSFPSEKLDYVSFTPPELVHKDTPITSSTEEMVEE